MTLLRRHFLICLSSNVTLLQNEIKYAFKGAFKYLFLKIIKFTYFISWILSFVIHLGYDYIITCAKGHVNTVVFSVSQVYWVQIHLWANSCWLAMSIWIINHLQTQCSNIKFGNISISLSVAVTSVNSVSDTWLVSLRKSSERNAESLESRWIANTTMERIINDKLRLLILS